MSYAFNLTPEDPRIVEAGGMRLPGIQCHKTWPGFCASWVETVLEEREQIRWYVLSQVGSGVKPFISIFALSAKSRSGEGSLSTLCD